MERMHVVRRVVRGIVVIGTVLGLMLAGGAPTDNGHRANSTTAGADR